MMQSLNWVWDDLLFAWISKNQTDENKETKEKQNKMDSSTYQYISSLDNNVTMLPILPIQLTNTTGTYLDHLNDYCLLDIFSCKSLRLMDLCSLAESCTRFKQITQRVFPKEFAIECLIISPQKYRFESKNYRNVYTLQEVGRILRSFGAHLTEVKICTHLDVVRWVEKYCGDSSLRRLKFSIDRATIRVKWILNLLPRLVTLTVRYCKLRMDFSSPGFNFDSLTELEVFYSNGCVTLLKHTFPNLERFTWVWSKMYKASSNKNCDVLLKFIRRHGHLKSIDVSDDSVSSIGFFHVIDSSCKELEQLAIGELMISKLSFDSTTPGGLAKLKKLDLNFRDLEHSQYMYYMPLLQALKSVKKIEIAYMYDSAVYLQIFDVLSRLYDLRELRLIQCDIRRIPWNILTQLRKVLLYGTLNSESLLNIIRHLINLEVLKCYVYYNDYTDDIFSLSEEKFSEIVKIVEGRAHVLTLRSPCSFVEKNCDKNQKVKLINA